MTVGYVPSFKVTLGVRRVNAGPNHECCLDSIDAGCTRTRESDLEAATG